MSSFNSSKSLYVAGWFGCSAAASAVGSACASLAGWVGAKILDSAGYADYDAETSARTSAVGAAVITGGVALLAFPCAVASSSSSNQKEDSSSSKSTLVVYVGDMVLSSMLGQAIQNEAGNVTLEFGKQVAATAVGAAVTAIPVTCAIVCFGGVTVAAVAGCFASAESSGAKKQTVTLGRPAVTFSTAVAQPAPTAEAAQTASEDSPVTGV